MNSLLSKLRIDSKPAAIEPREIFMTLLRKNKKYDYPRDVQSEVWRKWFKDRNNKNNIIKMNTGSGKTVVGLIILQSCLNEGMGPAVYVVPDNYLAAQVLKVAEELGINATDDKDSYQYGEKNAILVTNVFSLVNGRSVFGMRPYNNYPIGSIVIDDVHACLDTITSQFTIKIPAKHKLYEELAKLFAEDWKRYNYKSFFDIVKNGDPGQEELIPFWMWQGRQEEVYALLSKYNTSEDQNQFVYFHLPLIRDVLVTCDCIISAREIEIIPEGISISKIESFENAKRRIFMSATLPDDSVFVSSVGLRKEDVKTIITPDDANDIGDRLILFPRYLNNSITDEQIREKVITLSKVYNTVIIVPSFERAKYWDRSGESVITSNNIEEKINNLKTSHVGMVILVNRYDGIDLPDEACRLLVIDGLPPLKNKKDSYIQSIDPNSTILKREQIQRIEQGIGRGVRSNSDYCCVVLMGERLTNVLIHYNGTELFSNATRAQYDLSKKVWGLLETPSPSLDEIFKLADYTFKRDEEWIKISRDSLSGISYDSNLVIDNNVAALRKAFDCSEQMQWNRAINIITEAANVEKQKTTKGYLLQVKAKYTNVVDRSKAQEVLLSARNYSKAILLPEEGTLYKKEMVNTSQAKNICDFIIRENIDQNEYVIFIENLLSGLSFSEDENTVNVFEESFMKLGNALGFASSRPDKLTHGAGPDVLWGIENHKYFIIECKSAARADHITKDYCNQLGGSLRWFAEEYKSDEAIPIMIHKSIIIDEKATAVTGMKVIDEDRLWNLCKDVHSLAVAISQAGNWLNELKISELLRTYRFRGKEIVDKYMVNPQN